MGNLERKPVGAYRRIRYRVSTSKLRVPALWLRHRGLRSSDVFLGSYPRSGSTWLRFNLFEILTGRPADFASVNGGMRGPGTHYWGLPLLPGAGRFLSTHEPYRADYRKAVYLVRDIRDVVSSEFLYEKERGFGFEDFGEYLSQMLHGRRKYGSWQQHVRSWIHSDAARNGNCLLIRYEDMRQNPEMILGNLLEFLGKPVDSVAIRRAVANNALEQMRAKEDVLYSEPNQMRFPELPHSPAGGEGRFVRKGLVGTWREQLSQESISVIEKCAGTTLVELGYPLSS